MPTTPDNLTTLAITDADLLSRSQVVGKYLAPGANDFASEILAATKDALVDFEGFHGHDPARVVPRNPDSWKRVLAFYSLYLIFDGNSDERSIALADKYDKLRQDAMQAVHYQLDADESGTLDDSIEESLEFPTSLEIVR
jgi:hypothetical protein